MKTFFIFTILLMILPSSKKQLSDFRWENRLIITFEMPPMKGEDLNAKEFEERKLLLFQFQSQNLLFSNFEGEIDLDEFLRLRKKHQADYFLIGLDGGIKSYGNYKDFSVEKLMKQIDSMPMRQSELRGKKDGLY